MASGGGGMGAAGWLQVGSMAIDYFGLVEQGKIARINAQRQKLFRDFAVWNAERQGELAVAASQRQALEERRQADLVASRALAVAAASGAGVSDPTVVDIISRTKGEGHYRAAVALYEGEERSRSMRVAAAGGGDFSSVAAAGYKAAALGGLARRTLSLFAKYGLNGPGGKSSGDSNLIDAGTPDYTNIG